jgi:hypothetical protein
MTGCYGQLNNFVTVKDLKLNLGSVTNHIILRLIDEDLLLTRNLECRLRQERF